MSASEFYYACRNGDVTKVKALLTLMPTTEIDYIEPNGSTALHAAAYFGHIDVVRLLLDNGASPDQTNKYAKTPEEEAKTPEIAQLLHDIKLKLAGSWLIHDVFTATSQHRRFYSFNQGPPTLSYVVDKLLNSKELWFKQLEGNNEIDPVRTLFHEAIENKDAKCLIRAYTMETPFYHILNATLASHKELTDEERENPPWFCAYVRFLASDEPTLRPYRWSGTVYRGMVLRKQDLAQYQVGKRLMNKTFLSTSKSPLTDKTLAHTSTKKDACQVICKYIVQFDRAALDIKSISEYPAEEAVLLLPYMDVEITEINHSDKFVEITLLLH